MKTHEHNPVFVSSHLCHPVGHSGHWYRGIPVYQEGLALPEDQGGLSYPALRVVRVLFGVILMIVRGSGSRWSYTGTNDLQEEDKNTVFLAF